MSDWRLHCTHKVNIEYVCRWFVVHYMEYMLWLHIKEETDLEHLIIKASLIKVWFSINNYKLALIKLWNSIIWLGTSFSAYYAQTWSCVEHCHNFLPILITINLPTLNWQCLKIFFTLNFLWFFIPMQENLHYTISLY